MNYIKPEDIKEYVSQNPTGIAGMSEELAVMVNHFAELIVRECIDVISPYAVRMENFDGGHPIADLKKHFGVEE